MFRNISVFMDMAIQHGLFLIYKIPETVENNILN